MTGGFSSTAASEYISEHGLVQVSKEENTGILQVFSEGHVKKDAFLKIKPKSCPEITGSSVIEGGDIVSEYYPQKTTATYLGVTQLDLQPVDFVQLAICAAGIQLAVIIEFQISTA